LIKTSSTLGEEEVFSSGARSRFGLFDTPAEQKCRLGVLILLVVVVVH
jgi:hypothetical protein